MSKETGEVDGLLNFTVAICLSLFGGLIIGFAPGLWRLSCIPLFLVSLILILIFALGSPQLNRKAEGVLTGVWYWLALLLSFRWLY